CGKAGGDLACALEDADSVHDQLSDQASTGFSASDAGIDASDGAMPIVGKLLGLLIEAAGMTGTVKVPSQAPRLTPQPASDGEDAEYRREQLKIPAGKRDNKRGCLTTVFAKNFGDVMESILVMLGNKLVDWGIDILKGALQGVKVSLLTSAASVPFIGG